MASERKRNRLEIIHDILQVIRQRSGRIKPTHILYKSNLSHQMMEEYLTDLISRGFITVHKHERGRTYGITSKGLTYLEKYNTLVEFTDSFGLEQ